MWDLKHPDGAKKAATFKYFGQPVPKGLQPPELHDIEAGLYGDFWEVSTERLDSLRPIPFGAIERYSKRSGIGAHVFESIIRSVDRAYLEYKHEQHQKENKGN